MEVMSIFSPIGALVKSDPDSEETKSNKIREIVCRVHELKKQMWGPVLDGAYFVSTVGEHMQMRT